MRARARGTTLKLCYVENIRRVRGQKSKGEGRGDREGVQKMRDREEREGTAQFKYQEYY